MKYIVRTVDKFNIGQKAIVKYCESADFTPPMQAMVGQTVTITSIISAARKYYIREDNGRYYWCDQFFALPEQEQIDAAKENKSKLLSIFD